MSTQQSGAQRTLAVFVSLLVGAVAAAHLFPLAIGIWVEHFDLPAGASAGAVALVDLGDVALTMALFLFLVAVAIGAARRRRR